MILNKSLKSILSKIKILFFIIISTISYANQNHDDWHTYLDGSVGKNIYYLYNQVMSKSFQDKSSYRALDLGSGAGDVDFNLAALGWDVTSIDTSPRSNEIISARIKYINGKYNFQLSNFENATLVGNYDFVISFFSLPFGEKNNLSALIGKISQHMNSDALFAVNFFGKNHTFVKSGHAYGMTKDELFDLLNLNGFEIKYYLNRNFTQAGANGNPVNWDVLDVIARKI